VRSAAEQEIRTAVVDRLRLLRPAARICHEVNCGSGPTRMDLIAVDATEIIGVEIKSEKDVMKRAETQLKGMRDVAHHSILALHEVHLEEHETNAWAAHYGKLDGNHYALQVPKLEYGQIPWVYPERTRCANYDGETGPWREPERRLQFALPSTAIHLLWRDELAWLCDHLSVSRGRRSTMRDMVRALCWHANGKELTAGICAALRHRKFAEADTAIDLPQRVRISEFALT
jgi:hypothetical protein